MGYPVIYAGTTIEICALKTCVHLAGSAHPPLTLVCVHVPGDVALYIQSPLVALPPDWADLPSSASAQEFGRRWLALANQLVMLFAVCHYS